MASQTSLPPRRETDIRQHKSSKALALSIIAAGVIAFVGFIVADSLRVMGHAQERNDSVPDPNIVAVTPQSKGDRLQPMSPKIVALDQTSIMPSSPESTAIDYTDVWIKLDRLAASYGKPDNPDGTVSNEARMKFIVGFLDGLNYRMLEPFGPIVSKLNNEQISPETVVCYLNGYIPDKPYLKANCPTY